MANEIVVTSVPRGINLGRTGFQVVMRTAGISNGVMSILEQLAVYRHVPEGSGRNPVIYSYRSVRGPSGQLNVLGRTVDAGNDFSNRSNKLAHLLSVDPAELATLRNSSPAAVLAAIEGRLATVWQGGPEERVSPFALPSPPVQPAVCRRWEGVTGDAGWGGVLAQRAMRGQPSLVIAADCSPAWCRTLLELFQEVYALLPPDNRWRTTFDTTVIGSSSSLLRGTYAGSPESAAGHAGLLVVDLSSRVPVPANMATDDFVSVARQGPKQAVARGPSRMPSLPPTLEGPAGPMQPVGQTTVGQTTADPHHPPRAPDSWDDDEPKSRLHWYILCGVLFAAIALVGAVVGVWYWRDHAITKDCQDRIYVYAEADAGKPDGPKSEPKLDEWRRAFRDDKKFPTNDEFPLLRSAIATKKVGKSQVDSTEGRLKLLAAVQDVLQGKDVLGNAEILGVQVTRREDAKEHTVLESVVSGWINSTKPKIGDVRILQQAVDAATEVVAAAFDEQEGEALKNLGEKAVDFLRPKVMPVDKRSDVLKRFRKSLAANKAELSYKSAKDTLNAAVDAEVAAEQEKKKATETMTAEESQQDQAQLASNAFTTLRKQLAMYRPKPVTELTEGPVTLASKLDAKHLTFELSPPSCGNWKPEVEGPPSEDRGKRTWKLKGLPDDSDKHWGTVTLDKANNKLTFNSELDADAPQDHLYVPLLFSPKDDLAPELEPFPLTSLAAPEKVVAKASEGGSCSLYDVLTGGPVALTTSPALKVHPSLLGLPNALKVTLNSPRSDGPSDFVLDTRGSDGSQESTADLWLNATDGNPNAKQKIWLDSLSSECEARDGHIAIQLSRSRKKSPPWTDRATRFDDVSRGKKPFLKKPLVSDWNRKEFVNLVKTILDDHDPSNDSSKPKTNTINSLEKRIVECLELDEKSAETDKRAIDAWRDLMFGFVTKHESPFRTFVIMNYVMRPQEPQPPKEPSPKASPEEVKAHETVTSTYKKDKLKFDEDFRKWDVELTERLKTPLWLIRFLDKDESSQDPDARDFAVALLGIDAWLGLAEKRPEIEATFRELSLVSIFEATLELRWKWPNDFMTPVPRFTIQPGRPSE